MIRLCLFLGSITCLATVIGLVWVQWHIRHELDNLRTEVDSGNWIGFIVVFLACQCVVHPFHLVDSCIFYLTRHLQRRVDR